MTKTKAQTRALLEAYLNNKREPNPENLTAFFEVMDATDCAEVILPVLEIAYEAIDNLASNTGEDVLDVLATMRKVPLPTPIPA